MFRLIAYYLPQFHPIDENNRWWGEGFTEWTNVGNAKPLFKGHYQPKVPSNLGYYDLRYPEIREAQAKMAHKYGIEGFCYWHYWFGNGNRLLETPFNEILKLGKPDFPFCLGWANHTWYDKSWNNNKVKKKKILIEQKYPGTKDYICHFNTLLSAFKDNRYIRIDDKPIFIVYAPLEHPDMKLFIELWQNLAKQNNLKGIYFIGHVRDNENKEMVLNLGFDAVNIVRLNFIDSIRHTHQHFKLLLQRSLFNTPYKIPYKKAISLLTKEDDKQINCFPTILPNWDHTPRSGKEGLVLTNSSPELFRIHLQRIFSILKKKPKNRQIAFIKSWNEWGEGNYLEPDLKYGTKHLNTLKEEIEKFIGR